MLRPSVLKSIATIAASTGLVAASKATAQSKESLVTRAGKKPQAKQFIETRVIETRDDTLLFIQDWGTSKSILFIYSICLSSPISQYNMLPLSDRGFRCVAYDRRGHVRSIQPGRGYDYDGLADDLACVINPLDLRDLTLVGHSMGSAEMCRSLSFRAPRRRS